MSDRNPLEISSVCLGSYRTNCYLVRSDQHLWIVDAGFEPSALINDARATGLTPEAVILTHAHPDHMAGLDDVREAFPGVPVWIHRAEEQWLTDPMQNLSGLSGDPVTVAPADHLLNHGDELRLGELSWEVRHTPGHSPGSVSLICQNAPVALVGDALFRESVGRTDFPGCDASTLADSIRTQLYSLSDETTVFPGHGPSTTIGHERRHNPYVPGTT